VQKEWRGSINCGMGFTSEERLVVARCDGPIPSPGGLVEVLDVETGQSIVQKRFCGSVHAIALCAKRKRLAVAVRSTVFPFGSRILVLDPNSLETEVELQGAVPAFTTMTFGPKGNFLAAGNLHGRVTLWDVDAMDEPTSWQITAGLVSALAFSSDGKQLAVARCTEGASSAANVLPIQWARIEGSVEVWSVNGGGSPLKDWQVVLEGGPRWLSWTKDNNGVLAAGGNGNDGIAILLKPQN
jgi:WD40 repeat protein